MMELQPPADVDKSLNDGAVLPEDVIKVHFLVQNGPKKMDRMTPIWAEGLTGA